MTTRKPPHASIYYGVFDKAIRKSRWRKIGEAFVNPDGKSLAWHIEREVQLEPGAMLILRSGVGGRR